MNFLFNIRIVFSYRQIFRKIYGISILQFKGDDFIIYYSVLIVCIETSIVEFFLIRLLHLAVNF